MKIFVGKQTPEHKGDTSRELIDMWEESNLCEVIRGEVEDVFLWANEPNDVLLYEYDRFDVYPFLPREWNVGLFGGMQSEDIRAKPWIYWARRPRLLEKKIEEGVKTYDQRETESVFLGKIENSIQLHNRTQDNWFGVIEKFSMPNMMGDSTNWPFSQEDYLDIISCSKFGLCLAGYGPKCNREIEYLGLGVIPIVTDNVDLEYHNPLKEGEHYLKVSSAEEVPDLIKSCSKNQWQEISQNGQEWYKKNCSRDGSFNTTQEILQNG